jgi:hypothetical protein
MVQMDLVPLAESSNILPHIAPTSGAYFSARDNITYYYKPENLNTVGPTTENDIRNSVRYP